MRRQPVRSLYTYFGQVGGEPFTPKRLCSNADNLRQVIEVLVSCM